MKHCGILQYCGRFLLLLLTVPSVAGLTGCGMGTMSAVGTPGSGELTLAGLVHGGNQPVSGSTIQLYTAGSSGNGSAATPMLNPAVTTDASGNFNITSKYNCVHSTDQVYITSTGGNPGLAAGTNNNALVLMAAIGNCGNLSSTPFLFINEVTTAAAVYALAPFISPSATNAYANIGASSTNTTGLANAFLNAQLLANISNGTAATPASGLSIQSGKLYALADAISYCVNSPSSASTPCAALVTAATPSSGGAPAANTLATALSIVRHPGDTNIVGPVFSLINSQAPFTTTLTQAPSDWTMTMTITGGGLNNNSPTALAVDTSGNVWVANYNGVLSAFSPQGTAFNSTGYGSGTLNECFGLTIDTSGNIWVSNFELPSHSLPRGAITKFLGAGSGTPGSIVTNSNNSTYYFYDSSISYPTALAADTNGNIGIANFANSTATVYDHNGNIVSTGLASGNSSSPVAIAFDSSHGLWLANQGNGSVTHINSSGSVLAHPNCCSGPDGLALDASGNAWIANYSGGYVYGTSATGSSISTATGGGLSNSQPVGVAVDANQNIWVANGNGAVITELTDTGSAVSPSTGYGVDARLSDPHSIAPDASGNIWVSDFSNNALIMFFGIATPTVTPVQPVPTAP